MVPAALVTVWSGHSERATVASGLAALGVPRAERDPLGRWCAEGSDTYIRSYRALVKRLLQLFVSKARSLDGFVDLDEEDAILDGRRLFQKRGVDTEEGEKALTALLAASKAFFAAAVVVVQDGALDGKGTDAGPALEAGGDSDQEADYQYIVASTGRGRRATLHRRAGCWRAQRLAFGSYEFAQVLPDEGLYDKKCRDCWRARAAAPSVDVAASSSTGSTSSSS